ncbi:MAG: hypothetical protein M3Z98_05275 [Candidatus Dormibacteraeota bacterium]|nr:hypothetical protein [Candidatus Dormibacteraeota bacterium]
MKPQLDDSLLPGEDPVHIQEGDVELWISVYEELLAGSLHILQGMRGGGSQPIEQHIRRLEDGLAFWTRQRRPAAVVDPASVLALANWVDLRMPGVAHGTAATAKTPAGVTG